MEFKPSKRHAFSKIGTKPIDAISRTDVLAVLTPIWSTKPETARRVRQRMRTIFRWAMANELIEANPAGEAIDGALPTMPKVKAHLRALPYQEVGSAMKTVDASQTSPASKLWSEFSRSHSGAVRRGEGRNLGRDRSRGCGLDNTRLPHEGGHRAPGPSQRSGHRRVDAGSVNLKTVRG